ncbi:MAG TPA: hypothetical protein VEC94_09635 [Pseudolabrys sp.]|nr:hypothetical protein [Pseudolabrys sp.]
MAHGYDRHHGNAHTPAPAAAPQMTFAEIGTLYNSINNEVEGGVTPQNQALLFSQVITVQSQLQSLIDSGALNNLDGAGNPAISLVHAQNIADQMNFLKEQIAVYGTAANVPPKFINDVVRDVQDIVASDPQLTALAHQGNHAGFEQFSFLLTPPTPFPDTPLQTDTLLKFISDSNDLGSRAEALAGHDPNGPDKAAIAQLETDIHNFSVAADQYSTAQGGVFSARFNNEFTLNGVQGTASRELITGLQTGNADLVNGAAAVLMANANDVRGNMLANGLGPDGQPFVPAPNGGIPDNIDTVNVAGLVFNDSMTKLIGGVYSGNQQSIVNDLNATSTGLQAAITNQNITGHALSDINHVISLLGQEASLVGGIDTASPTPVSAVNGQINQIEAQILNIINHDATLATLAAGTDADGNPTTGFVALPPGSTPSATGVVAAAPNFGQSVAATTPAAPGNHASTGPLASTDPGTHGPQTVEHASHHFEHFWG